MPQNCLDQFRQKKEVTQAERMARKVAAQKKFMANWKIKKKLNEPWYFTYQHVRSRCLNKNATSYERYGGRGIKCLITLLQVKKLWFRDKAYLLKQPSIDRINNDGHYEIKNCRYIEHTENNPPFKKLCKYGHLKHIKKTKDGALRMGCLSCMKIRRNLPMTCGVPTKEYFRRATLKYGLRNLNLGLCRNCPRPLVTKSKCEIHRLL